MLISEKNKGIDFNVIGYEFPREKKSSKKEFNYDANWLSLKIYYRDGKKEKTYITPCLLTYELSELINVFQKIINGEQNSYISYFIEPCLSIRITNVDEFIIFVFSFVHVTSIGRRSKISITAKWTMSEAEEKVKELKDMELKFPKR